MKILALLLCTSPQNHYARRLSSQPMSLYKLLVQLWWEVDTPPWCQVRLLELDTSDQHVSELKN